MSTFQRTFLAVILGLLGVPLVLGGALMLYVVLGAHYEPSYGFYLCWSIPTLLVGAAFWAVAWRLLGDEERHSPSIIHQACPHCGSHFKGKPTICKYCGGHFD